MGRQRRWAIVRLPVWGRVVLPARRQGKRAGMYVITRIRKSSDSRGEATRHKSQAERVQTDSTGWHGWPTVGAVIAHVC